MYLHHFAFTRLPFDTGLQTEVLFASNARREAEARLKHLIELRGMGLLTRPTAPPRPSPLPSAEPARYRTHTRSAVLKPP